MKRNTFLKSIGGILGLGLLGFKSKPTIKQNSVIIFTPEILKKYNFGLYIINDKADVMARPDYAATVAWKLGWSLGVAKNADFYLKGVKHKGETFEWPKYNKINFLTDGWIFPIGDTKEGVCNYLNNNEYGEKYRIMTKEELLYIINNRSNSKQLFYE